MSVFGESASARPCSHVRVSGRTEQRDISGKQTKGSESGSGDFVIFRHMLLWRTDRGVDAPGGAHVPFE